jgi:hypothetical protein
MERRAQGICEQVIESLGMEWKLGKVRIGRSEEGDRAAIREKMRHKPHLEYDNRTRMPDK